MTSKTAERLHTQFCKAAEPRAREWISSFISRLEDFSSKPSFSGTIFLPLSEEKLSIFEARVAVAILGAEYGFKVFGYEGTPTHIEIFFSKSIEIRLVRQFEEEAARRDCKEADQVALDLHDAQ